MRRFFIFFILIVSCGVFLCVSAFVQPVYLVEMTIVSGVTYGVGLFCDVKSTMSFGRGAVGVMEASPVFRILSRRYGFGVAIPVQVLTELLLAVVLSFAVNYQYNPVTTYFCLFLFCGIHLLGYRKNAITLSRY